LTHGSEEDDMIKLRSVFTMVGLLLVCTLPAAAQTSEVQDLYRQSYALEARAKPAQALEAMNKVQSKAGPSYFAHARTAWLAYLAGRYDVAEAQYRAAIAAKPKAVEPLLGLSLVLLAQSKWRDLELTCRDVLKLDPKNVFGRARLAHAHYSVGNYPDAATLYRQLVEEYPADLDHQTGLGWALARMGRVAEGKALFKEVLAVSPDNPNALQGMAMP
jgi:tetratricopeptide (TPR) repeat protein